MKILILGWYGHQNLGDENYKTTIPQFFGQAHEYRFLDLLTGDDVNWCDIIVVGGGCVLKEYYINQLGPITKPIYGLSVSVEGNAYGGFKRFEHVWARDNHTVNILKNLGISVSFLPDLAYLLLPDPAKGLDWMKKVFAAENRHLYEKKVVAVINGYVMRGGHDDPPREAFNFIDFSYKVSKLADETNASFIFLPFGTDGGCDDRTSNAWIASKCKWWKKTYIEFGRPGVQETLDIIAASDAMISMRLHSSIFAHSAGVPLMDIVHHSKNEAFLETFNKQSSLLSYWHFDGSAGRKLMDTCLKSPREAGGETWRGLIRKEINGLCCMEPGSSNRSGFRPAVQAQ